MTVVHVLTVELQVPSCSNQAAAAMASAVISSWLLSKSSRKS